MGEASASFPYRWRLTYEAYRKKIHTFARNEVWRLQGYAVEDLEQELLEVLYNTVLDYDPNRGAKFNTYFTQRAKNRIATLARRDMAQCRNAIVYSIDQEGALRNLIMGDSVSKGDRGFLNLSVIDNIFTDSPEEEVMAWEGLREMLA